VEAVYGVIERAGLASDIKMTYLKNSNTVEINIDEATITSIEFVRSSKLPEMLGIENYTTKLVFGTFKGFVQLPRLDEMYIYTSLIEGHMVGSHAQKLLRIVPLKDVHYDTPYHYEFNTPHYESVAKGGLHMATFEIRDRYGELVPFTTGTQVVMVLHFRPRYK
jgi:hypothetical protein